MNFSEHYQALFYLSSGFASFLLLFLILRLSASPKPTTNKVASSEDVWGKKEALKIVEVIGETPDIKSFRMQRENLKPFPKFKPGQFLSFQIGEDPKCLRSYSISSSSGNNGLLQVSIKHIKDGKGSSWFHERKAGDKVYAFPPSGLFTDCDLENETRVYVAGGIGITPCLSMIQSNLDGGKQFKMVLYYGARTEKDLAFHAQLELLASRHHNFSYFPILSKKDGGWSGAEGHITAEFIKAKSPISPQTRYFLCGPPLMTDSVMSALLAENVVPEAIHNEKFASPTAFDPEKIPVRTVKVECLGRELHYSGKFTLLEFLEAQGENPPFACRVGVCGTCKTRIIGKTEAITDAGLSMVEKKQNLVLTCVAYPIEDIKIEIG